MPQAEQQTCAAFGAALDVLPCAVLVVDARAAERTVIYANPAFTEITGFPAAAAIGRSTQFLLAAGADPIAQQQLRTAIASSEAFNGELTICRSDGRSLWVRVCVRPAGSQIVVTLENIADHKRARESLHTSEARLEVAMEASALAMWDWHVARDEVYYNDQWQALLGIEAHELLKCDQLAQRLSLPADAPAILEQFERHCSGATPHFECEYSLRVAHGGSKWVLARAKVVRRDAQGRPLRVIGVLRDISRRKRELHDALEVQQRWERAVRGTSDGLYDWDLLTGHVWYADRFREIIGYAQREFPDTFQAFQDVLHVEDRALVLGKIRVHLENQSALDVRCRVQTPDGAMLWCRMRGQAARDAAGRPLRLAGSISDISAQVDAEQALLRSQDFYGTILDSLPLYIAYADRDERVVYTNKQFHEFFSETFATSRGRLMREVIGERRYEAVGPYVREALRGKLLDGQGRYPDNTGRKLDVEATFVPHRAASGEVSGCFIVARDVTERRLLEAELRQSQKMEAVGRLTGGIAHDFNNLLSVIVGNMQLLARSLYSTPRLLRQAETALKAAMRGADLTRRLLAFARQQVLEPRVVDLNALIAGMYELLRRTLADDIEIERRFEPTAWPTKVDPSQLENAILNLVINARDAMPNGGVITIATYNASVVDRTPREEGLAPGDYAIVEVKDTGAGMSEETLKRVFEPFFTTKDVGKGSGLGLSMVYGFVKQSGGRVAIDSAPGRGTSVYLYFPRTQAALEGTSLEADAPAELPRGHETILVVEDNAEVRATVVDLLSSLGYRVLGAATGREALEQFMRQADVALVFSDVMLPGGLLGTNLVQKLRDSRPSLKVLMTSGFIDSAIMRRAMLDGSIDVLAKPYKIDDLARRVRAALDGKEEIQRVPA
jgi:PAS domain S-box-containing protein